MEKLSVLIPSLNDIDTLLELIEHLQGVADQIVVVDSSAPKEAKRLRLMKEGLKRKKTTVFTAIATGFSEPIRQYGITKCIHNWVLLLDTDERLNPQLMADIKGIITNTKDAGFLMRRYEYEYTMEKPAWISRQLRLYKGGLTRYKGDMHEQPNVNGKVALLDEKYYIIHNTAEHKSKAVKKYNYKVSYGLESYLRRLSYDVVLDRLRPNPLAHSVLSSIFAIKGKNGRSKEELSHFDYWFILTVNSLTWFPSVVKNLGFSNYVGIIINNQRYERRKLKYFSTLPKSLSDMQLKISSDIYWNGGLIKYLHLDDEKWMKMWLKKYADVKNERSVLFDMLKEEYKRRHGG